MLRKTNTNRASLRRAHEDRHGSPVRASHEQLDTRCDSRSSSIVYNSSNRSTTPSTGNDQLNKPDAKQPYNNNDINDNDDWDTNHLKTTWNDNEKWKKSWNDNDESNDCMPWNESTDFSRALPTENPRPESAGSGSKRTQPESKMESPDSSCQGIVLNAVTSTELVPGLILEGQVADL